MQILTFSMSRRYDVNFMTEEDHETIYQQYAKAPNVEEVIGKWNGKLVSDSALTPVTQVFNYTKDNSVSYRWNIRLEDYLRESQELF